MSPSGAKYVFKHAGNNEVAFDLDAQSASPDTFTVHTTFIRQGEDGTEEDYNAQLVLHVTQNANGELTAEVLSFKPECH